MIKMNKNKIITIILFFVFIVLSISTIYDINRQQQYIELKQKQTFQTTQQIIDGKIIFFRKLFATRVKNIIRKNPMVKKAIKSQDHKKIKKTFDSIFKILKRENIYTKTLHLISPNNISIYRAHKPNKFGDDLSNIRPIIDYVNKYKKAKYGFETGVYAAVYRIDIPIFYNKKYYGILEYGIDPNIFISDLTSVSNYIKSTITLNKSNCKSNIKDRKKLIINGHTHLISNNKFFNNININTNKNFYKDNKYYSIYLYDLLNFQAKSVGHIVIALDITADKKRKINIIKISIINQIILLGVIFIIVYYAFNYYEKQIHKLIAQEKNNEKILYQQSKMAAMGEMIGNIAHQWRQPLSAISTISSGIAAQKEYGIFNESTLLDSMEKITKQTQYMSNTINDFRDFFKPDTKKVKFILKYTLKKDINLIKHSFQTNNIEILESYDDTIELLGYENQLVQAIVNILNNAKDQLINKNIEDKVVSIKAKQDNKSIYIIIQDNAGGIPKDILPKIFEPYFTTKHQAQGTGIGLYMTHEIIEKHFNGTIKASNTTIDYNNTQYTGAIFEIIIPKNIIKV